MLCCANIHTYVCLCVALYVVISIFNIIYSIMSYYVHVSYTCLLSCNLVIYMY